MKNENIFRHYLNLAELLGEMFKPWLEVIVHDLSDPRHSIIAIYNGHITGRKIGDSTSDLGMKRLKGEVPDKIFGYENTAPNGEKLKSSTLAIRDEEGKILGSFSLNLQVSYFEKFKSLIDMIISAAPSEHTSTREEFHFFTPRDEISHIYDEYLLHQGLTGRHLTALEKKEAILYLHKHGHFNKRGIVTIIAEKLGVTRNTIYRYIREISRK